MFVPNCDVCGREFTKFKPEDFVIDDEPIKAVHHALADDLNGCSTCSDCCGASMTMIYEVEKSVYTMLKLYYKGYGARAGIREFKAKYPWLAEIVDRIIRVGFDMYDEDLMKKRTERMRKYNEEGELDGDAFED